MAAMPDQPRAEDDGQMSDGRTPYMSLTEYQEKFKEQYAQVVEGMYPRGCGPLAVHEHDGDRWGCCTSCAWAWRAHTNTDPTREGFVLGEPLLTSTGGRLWH